MAQCSSLSVSDDYQPAAWSCILHGAWTQIMFKHYSYFPHGYQKNSYPKLDLLNREIDHSETRLAHAFHMQGLEFRGEGRSYS